MKSLKIISALSLAALGVAVAGPSLVDDPAPVIDPKNVVLHDDHANLWDPHRVDSHAPIGVMGDHTHEAGEFMLSYRYMFMQMQGMRDGTTDLSSADVFALGFPVTPTEMTMEMHMLGLMFAPSDWLTLMLMGSYITTEMDHLTAPGTMPRMMRGETFTTRGSNFGDTKFSGLIKFLDYDNMRAHFQLGVSAPTGSIDEEDPGQLPYPMQTGSGTWDLLVGPTFLHQFERWSYGAQALGTLRLGENDRNYTLGDKFDTTFWVAVPLCDKLSISGRLAYMYQDDIDGFDAALNPNLVPTAVPDFHDRHRLDAALGANLYLPNGHRFAAEVSVPLYEETGGPMLETDWWFTVGWQKAF